MLRFKYMNNLVIINTSFQPLGVFTMQTTFLDITPHCDNRMNQRGITKEMMYIVLQHGRVKQDCYILNVKDAISVLHEHYRQRRQQTHIDEGIEYEIRLLKKIIDKGGLVVVEANNRCRTAYNFNSKDWEQFKPNYAHGKRHLS